MKKNFIRNISIYKISKINCKSKFRNNHINKSKNSKSAYKKRTSLNFKKGNSNPSEKYQSSKI
jgi:hypothetical protein